MLMQLSVGVSKKQGLPDYGSLGASCNVTIELDGALLSHDLAEFQRHVNNAYTACAQAVNDELARQRADNTNGTSNRIPDHSAPRQNRVDGSTAGNGNSNGNNGHQVTSKQTEYIDQLARQISGLGTGGLKTLCNKMFSKPLSGLNSLDASALIDCLKNIKAGKIDLDVALNGVAT